MDKVRSKGGLGMAPPGGEEGFTLIELLVVLVMLSLTAGLLVGRGPARSPALDIRAATGQVAQGLRLARSQAIARNQAIPFVLDVAGSSYRIGDGPPRALPRGLGLSMTAVAGNTVGARIGAITFLPDGSSSGGRVGLSTGARHVWVGVDWLTGRVSVRDAP
jgi:general secretion pathway protein H